MLGSIGFHATPDSLFGTAPPYAILDSCSSFVLKWEMTRRFPPPGTVDRPHPDSFVGKDGNGIVVATVHCRDDLQKWSFGHSKLTSDEARRIR